mmetsp:Transcript_51094/g.94535  ORF Transcript_51094/g.94535 Transcript_51094/m.94535 type:complete len:338 (-) Transcript_51094:57-1070(-)
MVGQLAPGSRVKVQSTDEAWLLNGLTGTCGGYVPDAGRWYVLPDGGGNAEFLRPENLVLMEAAAEEYGINHSPTKQATGAATTPRQSSQKNGQLKLEKDSLIQTLAQWQRAYDILQDRNTFLEQENKRLSDVICAVEEGNCMEKRFVARLAHQNLRLGAELADRDTAEAEQAAEQKGSRVDAEELLKCQIGPPVMAVNEDNNNGHRPPGVGRLPLNVGGLSAHQAAVVSEKGSELDATERSTSSSDCSVHDCSDDNELECAVRRHRVAVDGAALGRHDQSRNGGVTTASVQGTSKDLPASTRTARAALGAVAMVAIPLLWSLSQYAMHLSGREEVEL